MRWLGVYFKFMTSFFISGGVLIWSGLLFAALPPLPELLEQGRSALSSNQPKAAFSLLVQHEPEYAGKPEFDYWLGVAAVRSGESSYALLVLDRVLMEQPRHAGARMERALAMLQLNMLDQADEEFVTLQQQNPPAVAAKAIEHYRTVIAERKEKQKAPIHTFMLRGGAGYDSNVNTAPSDYILELFGGLFQAEIDAQGGSFIEQQALYSGYFPMTERDSLQVKMVGQARQYQKSALEDFNLAVAQGEVQWRHLLAKERVLSSTMSLARLSTGKSYSGLLWQLSAESGISFPVMEQSALAMTGHWRKVDYDKQSTSNMQAVTVEADLRTPLSQNLRSGVVLSIEREFADGNRDGGDAVRLRSAFDLSYQLNSEHQLSLGFEYLQLRYDDKGFLVYNDLVAVKRSDSSGLASLNWNWKLNPNWMLSSAVRYRKQNSDVDFFDYEQRSLNAGLSYLWR